MRWIFFSLLVGNVAFFSWGWFENSRQQRLAELNQISGSRDMPGEHLQLVSELTPEQQQILSIDAPVKEEPAQQVKDAELAEPVATEETEQKEGDAPEEVAIQDTQGKELCMMIGPLQDEQQAPQLKERLKALGLAAESLSVDIEGAPDYWVIVSPAEGKKEALQTLRELQAKNIESYLIPQGDMANAISLGVFGQEANAEKQKEELSLLGYPIEVRAKPHSYKEEWLVLGGEDAQQLGDEIWLGIQEDFPDLEKRPGYCTPENPVEPEEKAEESTETNETVAQ